MNSPNSNDGLKTKLSLPWMNRLEQAIWAVFLAFFILLSSIYFAFHQLRQSRFIDIEQNVPRLDYQLAIDINSAEWYELTALPGISENYARRIVEFRSRHGRFHTIDELVNVPGIGPKRLEQIRNYLHIDTTTDSTEHSEHPEIQSGAR